MVLGPELTPLGLDFLTEAAVVGSLTPEAAAILARFNGLDDGAGRESTREILGILEHDGYLKRPVKEYVFVSRLLKEWWKARFGFAYVPAADRSV